jgi:phosphonate transport system substrate-binding protein
MFRPTIRTVAAAALVATLTVAVAACGSSPGATQGQNGGRSATTFTIGAIPDQDPQVLQRLYGVVSEYLGKALGVEVEYVPVTDYTASVAAFRRGDLQMVFFGGLTGVQARLQVPGAQPIAQRDIDADFHSVFVAGAASGIATISDVSGLSALAGHTFTLGSQTSTSGSLMPQYFLSEAGLQLDDFTGEVGYSGSHDATIKLVQAGTYQVGALNAAVWDSRVKDDKVDTNQVREVFRTPAYHDYHWLIRPDADEQFGDGFTQRAKDALLGLDGSDEQERQILELFQAGKFIETSAENYDQIETIGRAIGLIK